MPRRTDAVSGAISLQELRDIVDRLGEGLGEAKQDAGNASIEAGAVLERAHALRTMLRGLGPKAPERFADRIVAAALERDPVPDAAAIHKLKS